MERSQALYCSQVTAATGLQEDPQPAPLGLPAPTCPVQRWGPRRPLRQGCVPAVCEVG